MLQLPARIGKYELEQFLGGGMSHVYRARDTVLNRTVAIKILTDEANMETRVRFLQEARTAGNLVHDNVMSIYDFGEDDRQQPYMVMEFLRGEDLRHAIDRGHTGDLRRKLEIALQIARALEYIHTQKIVHRDIKPENIHIAPNGVVKLMDFGIAKSESMSLTREGFVLGTPCYMAPEQVMGKPVTPQVDIYAFGILLFEVITGVKPITAEKVERLFYAILNEPINLEPLKRAGAPQPVVDLVTRCTAKDAAQRPQSFAQVCSELENMVQPAPAPTAAVKAAHRRREWLWRAIAVMAVLCAVLGWWIATRGPRLPESITTPTGEMVLVPAGPFLSGPKKESVSLPAFYIDKTEVTNAAYAQFCNASGHKPPATLDERHPDYPVVGISIAEAQVYARWAGKRLPTGREWEKAARGTDGRMFPWGNERDPSRANLAGGSGISSVNAFPQGASPYGVLQMVGNVWEFVDQLSSPGSLAIDYFGKNMTPPPSPTELWYAIRGQAFDQKLDDGAVWDSTTVPARWTDRNIGFRCAKDP